MRRLLTLSFLATLAVGCAGSDDRVAAAQNAFDESHMDWEFVETGNVCYDGNIMTTDPNRYVGIPGATVGPKEREVGSPRGYCRTVAWDPKDLVSPNQVSKGRYVIEKIGPTQDTMGIESAQVRAKLEPSAIGRSMIENNLVSNKLVYETYVTLSKDVDGKTVAHLPISLSQ